jgi:hypothetical protein
MIYSQILIFEFFNLLNHFLAIFWALRHPLLTVIIFFLEFLVFSQNIFYLFLK